MQLLAVRKWKSAETIAYLLNKVSGGGNYDNYENCDLYRLIFPEGASFGCGGRALTDYFDDVSVAVGDFAGFDDEL